MAHVGSCSNDMERKAFDAMGDVIRPRRRAAIFRGSVASATGPSAVFLGDAHEHWGQMFSLRGQLVSVAIFADALTDAEVKAIFVRGETEETP